MKEIIINCGECGKEFATKSVRRKLCDECRKFKAVEQKERHNEKMRIEKLKKKIGNSQLVEDARAAKKLGMSYGNYKALPEKVKLKKKMELIG